MSLNIDDIASAFINANPRRVDYFGNCFLFVCKVFVLNIVFVYRIVIEEIVLFFNFFRDCRKIVVEKSNKIPRLCGEGVE